MKNTIESIKKAKLIVSHLQSAKESFWSELTQEDLSNMRQSLDEAHEKRKDKLCFLVSGLLSWPPVMYLIFSYLYSFKNSLDGFDVIMGLVVSSLLGSLVMVFLHPSLSVLLEVCNLSIDNEDLVKARRALSPVSNNDIKEEHYTWLADSNVKKYKDRVVKMGREVIKFDFDMVKKLGEKADDEKAVLLFKEGDASSQSTLQTGAKEDSFKVSEPARWVIPQESAGAKEKLLPIETQIPSLRVKE